MGQQKVKIKTWASLPCWFQKTGKTFLQPVFLFGHSFMENPLNIQCPVPQFELFAIKLWVCRRDSFENIPPSCFRFKEGRRAHVVTKYCTKASFLNVPLCNIRKPLRKRCSRKMRSLTPVMAEEEPVAVPQPLELILDDAGKEGSHLHRQRNEDDKNIKSSPFHRQVQFQRDQR